MLPAAIRRIHGLLTFGTHQRDRSQHFKQISGGTAHIPIATSEARYDPFSLRTLLPKVLNPVVFRLRRTRITGNAIAGVRHTLIDDRNEVRVHVLNFVELDHVDGQAAGSIHVEQTKTEKHCSFVDEAALQHLLGATLIHHEVVNHCTLNQRSHIISRQTPNLFIAGSDVQHIQGRRTGNTNSTVDG